MKSRLVVLVLVFVLSTLASAQQRPAKEALPAPALSNVPEEDEIAISPIVNLHSDGNAGYGTNATLSHYFTRRFGITADGEYLTSNLYDLHEYAFRVGPTVRFHEKGRVQPFARGLLGYARVKATYTADQKSIGGPISSYPYDDSASFLLGAGADIALMGPLSARVAGDFIDDLGTHNDKTRMLRLGVGIVYRFGLGGQ